MIWLLEEQKLVISKDVVFNEKNLFKDLVSEKIEIVPVTKEKHKRMVTFCEDLVSDLRKKDLKESSSDQGREVSGQGGVTSELEQEKETEDISSDEDDTSSGAPNLDNYLLARDRPRRQPKPPSKFEGTDYAVYALASADSINVEEPKSYAEAMRSNSSKLWSLGADEEMDSLNRNHMWVLTDRPKDQKIIGNKWVFKLKPGMTEIEQPRHKARLVAKGFAHIKGIDYNEVFAPMVKHVSIRLLLSAVVNHDMELEQLDVKTAFLHGILQ